METANIHEGMQSALARIEAQRLAAAWPHGPAIRVVATARELPGAPCEQAIGRFRGGRVFLVAGQGPVSIGRTAAHEAIGHAGVRLALGRAAWRRFVLGLRTAAAKGSDTFLRGLRRRVRSTYTDARGRALRPALEGDEILAAMAEEVFDRRSGRVLVHDPVQKQAEALVALAAREWGLAVPVTASEAEGVLLLAERRLRDGDLVFGLSVRARRVFRWLATACSVTMLAAWLAF